MKRLAIFIGGLLVLPAFAEVAPVFINEENALEYADAVYDENGFLIIPDQEVVEETDETVVQKNQTPVKISRAPVNATPIANRSTSTRAMPSAGRANTSGRGAAAGNSSRVVAARTTTNASGRGNTSRAVASRGTANTSPRTTATTSSTRATTNTAATRAAAARTTGGSSRVASSGGATVARTGTVARTATSSRGSARVGTTSAGMSRAAMAGAGRLSVNSERIGTAVKTASTVGVASGGVSAFDSDNSPLYKSASTRRTPTIRMSSVNGISTESTAVSTMSLEDMDDLAEMTDYCKAQYAACMDNYCNVLDDNQGRCSCSANLKNYAKAEQALKTATEELQDVAQKIQYIGLTTREVETLFSQTEAELAMQSKTDNSQLQSSLNKIKDMIVDVKSGGATSNSGGFNGGLNFDLSGLLEFSFDSTGFDLASLFGNTSTNSVSNQRGEELYKTASSRCKTSVVKACTARGVDASLITNAYDLEIDRECIMYERSLNDSNDQMIATVRNAKNVLQKARLMVAQQKNAYDMRGCINALDSCMQDEFVCGSDYENCLDPTGRYIVNGEIVIGSQPGHAIDPEISSRVASVMTSDVCRVNLYRTWDFPNTTCHEHDGSASSNDVWAPNYMSRPTYDQGNAWGSGTGDNLVAYIDETVTANAAKNASENMSEYLQNKIGYVNQKDGRAYGMCISVLNKCQDYTYTGKGTSAKYNPQNDVIKQYLGRVLVQIKSKQDEILANYAETCVSDVTSCLSQNGYPSEDPSEWGASTSTEYITNVTKTNIAINACRAQVVTCMSVNGYSIDTPTPTEMNCWVQGLLFNYTTKDCLAYHSSTVSCGPGAYLGYCGESECGTNGGHWCNGYCQQNECSTDRCSSNTPEYCQDGSSCGNVGGVWCAVNNHCYGTQSEYDALCGDYYVVSRSCSTCNNGTDLPSASYQSGTSVRMQGASCLTQELYDAGWRVDETYGSGTGWNCNNVTVGKSGSFTMPARNVSCSQFCIKSGNVTPEGEEGLYQVTRICTNCGSDIPTSKPFNSGESVQLESCIKNDLYNFEGMSCMGENNVPVQLGNNGTFTMPKTNVTCEQTCSSSESKTYEVSINCGSGQTACIGSDTSISSHGSGSTVNLSGYCTAPSGTSLNWGCLNGTTNAHISFNNGGQSFYMPSADVACTATCTGGGSSGHKFTANCGSGCTKQSNTPVTISTSQNINLNNYCTAPSGGNISWSCEGQTFDSVVKVQMPDHDYSCTATCTGGSGGGGDQTPPAGKGMITYNCAGDNNDGAMNTDVLLATYTDNTYIAQNKTFTVTVDPGNVKLASADACCPSGVEEWIVTSSKVSMTKGSSEKPVEGFLTVAADTSYTIKPVCKSTTTDECTVTLQPGTNCPSGQAAETVSCDTTKTNAPQFFENFGAQTWSCNPSNVISNLSDLNEPDEYGISHGTGSMSLSGNSGTCTANCIPKGYVDIDCGEGTPNTDTVPRIYPSTNTQGTNNYPPTAHVLNPIAYCDAPVGKEQYQWSCVSNLDGGGETRIEDGWTAVSVYPGEQITCTAQWQSGTSSTAFKLTKKCCDENETETVTDVSQGDPVTLSCTGVNVTSWNCGSSVTVSNNTFTMPDFSVVCTATCTGSASQYDFRSITLQGASL